MWAVAEDRAAPGTVRPQGDFTGPFGRGERLAFGEFSTFFTID